MINVRPVLFVFGILLTTLAIAMTLPVAVDLAVDNDDWQVFAVSAAFTFFVGMLLLLACRGSLRNLTTRQTFLLVTVVWLFLPAFAATPFAFSDLELTYTDAYFEAMSGMTTTGSTVIVGLDTAPPGILLWRSLLQWLGGIGIVVMALAVLPVLGVGGMQIFRMEFAERVEKALPRAAQIGAWITAIYAVLTLICAVLYFMVGMTPFDAVNHAMTTLATAGFSTRDSSFAYFDSQAIQIVATVFMVIGSLPFLLFFQAVRGAPLTLFRDTQVRTFFAILLAAWALMVLYLLSLGGWDVFDAIVHTAFNATSIMTGTGYASTDFGLWGAFANPLFFVLMFIGGCAGSTTCAIKIFRFQVLFSTLRVQVRRLLQPHGVFIAYFNRKPIPEGVPESVMSFFFAYLTIFALLAMALGMMGLDFVTATSGAATAISNVGPGLGPEIGPAGNFANLPDGAKWLLAMGMLLGRLEIFTVLVLLSPRFWKI